MKVVWIITVAACRLTWNVLGQGAFVFDNSADPNGFTLDRPGNYYSGGGGIEVWEANTTAATLMAQINSTASGVAAYALLGASGFKLEATYAGVVFNIGSLDLGTPTDMPDVTPPGATVTVALVAWNTTDRSAAAAIADPNPATRLGVRAVIQPTVIYSIVETPPGIVPLGGDIVMAAIPEPSWLGLFTLAAAVYWLARRSGLRPPKRGIGRR